MSRTVLFAVHNGFAARYLLRTDIFKVLRDSGVSIVILTPNADEAYFNEEFGGPGVFIERLELAKCQDYFKNSPLPRTLGKIRISAISADADLTTLNIKQKKFWSTLRKKNPVRAAFMWRVVLLLRRSRRLRRSFIWMESRLFPGNFHEEVFKRYKPDLVVTASTGYFQSDAVVLREAMKHRARTLAVILSWDNPTSKGMGGGLANHAVAWTESMKQELMTYLDFRESDVFVGGVAHWDLYHRDWERPSRDGFLEELGLDPRRKTIVLGTKSPKTHPRHDVLTLLAEAINQDRFAFPCQLLVRIHPQYFNPSYGDGAIKDARALASHYKHVALSIPQIRSNKLPFDMDPDDMVQLDAILHHSDVLVNFHSTLTLEASICDLPVAHVGFEKPDDNDDPSYQAVASYGNYVHLQRVIETGGVPTAVSPAHLIELIDEYLADPSLNAEGRAMIAKQEAGPNPGHAGHEIGEFILGRVP